MGDPKWYEKEKSPTESEYWRIKWMWAWANMPMRIQYSHYIEHEDRTGTIPLGEYIKGTVKKRLRVIDGRVYEAVKTLEPYGCGQQMMLARILGYYTKRYKYKNGKREFYKVVPSHCTVYNNLARGSKPRARWRRDLLLALANKENGMFVARDKLKEMGLWKEGVHRLRDEMPEELRNRWPMSYLLRKRIMR